MQLLFRLPTPKCLTVSCVSLRKCSSSGSLQRGQGIQGEKTYGRTTIIVKILACRFRVSKQANRRRKPRRNPHCEKTNRCVYEAFSFKEHRTSSGCNQSADVHSLFYSWMTKDGSTLERSSDQARGHATENRNSGKMSTKESSAQYTLTPSRTHSLKPSLKLLQLLTLCSTWVEKADSLSLHSDGRHTHTHTSPPPSLGHLIRSHRDDMGQHQSSISAEQMQIKLTSFSGDQIVTVKLVQ